MERMEGGEYSYSMARAKDSAAETSSPKFKGFWNSYRRGLRHYYRGKGYQNVKEPKKVTTEEVDYGILGYDLGYSGMPFHEAYRDITCLAVFQKLTGMPFHEAYRNMTCLAVFQKLKGSKKDD
ncbi:MAG: hypothetical protein DDT18_01819 [Actinobacteria bacterium]|nr:hypothetical protein [Actinomycetota bacterium]